MDLYLRVIAPLMPYGAIQSLSMLRSITRNSAVCLRRHFVELQTNTSECLQQRLSELGDVISYNPHICISHLIRIPGFRSFSICLIEHMSDLLDG